ncbi:hypothetical protein, partial [Chryseobacterium sp. EO14]|uniref:hypothetical protein n=1 Tax=Chryseobacterium sp. EO14 TaxID=2950551 RepID=UPI00210E66D2
VSANLFEFLGLNDQLSSILPVLGNGGGSSASGGMTFTGTSMIQFLQGFFGNGGSVGALFSVIEQLKKAGFKDPANDKATFNDYKKIIKTDAISELLGVYYNASKTKEGYEYGFIEVKSSLFKGRADGGKMLISPKNISNVLDYFFTIGHEMNHSIMGYFRNTFYETINSTPNSPTARSAFDYFGEYNSYSWEQRLGNPDVSDAWKVTYSKHGPGLKIQDLYIGYPQQSIDVVKNNLIRLERAWSVFYNNNLKK